MYCAANCPATTRRDERKQENATTIVMCSAMKIASMDAMETGVFVFHTVLLELQSRVRSSLRAPKEALPMHDHPAQTRAPGRVVNNVRTKYLHLARVKWVEAARTGKVLSTCLDARTPLVSEALLLTLAKRLQRA